MGHGPGWSRWVSSACPRKVQPNEIPQNTIIEAPTLGSMALSRCDVTSPHHENHCEAWRLRRGAVKLLRGSKAPADTLPLCNLTETLPQKYWRVSGATHPVSHF